MPLQTGGSVGRKRSTKEAIEKLKTLLKDRCLIDTLSKTQYAYDATQIMYPPDVVVLPETTEEVSEILKIASRYKIPIVPRGWASGFTGGALNTQGGIALSVEKMDRIVEFDEENLMVWVEAGVVNYDLQEFLKPFGLMFPPDPSSWKFSTIAGNIAENAGGPRAVKYGVTKNWVKALEIVMPDGSIITVGSKNIKDVAGYNLVDLIVGSEGTLAVITKALLKLHPLPESKKTIQILFSSMKEAVKTVHSIVKNRIIPAAIEFVDKEALIAVEDAFKIGLPTEAEAMLIVEVDGSHAGVEEDSDKIEKLCLNNDSVISLKTATNEQEEEELWLARRSISPTLKRIADGKINEDIVVPLSRLPDMIEATQEIAKKYSLKIVNFGHAGDGNIHVNIMYHTDKKTEKENALKAMDEVFRTCLRLGGTITGEHGVGITKQDYLKLQVGEKTMDLYRGIKRVFDPDNILNPGKMGL